MLIVFVNIILNAIQSIGEKEGHVTIRIQESSSNIVIEFENSGPNIPEKDLKRIFDTLYTTKLEGTGLGLSIVKEITSPSISARLASALAGSRTAEQRGWRLRSDPQL